MSRPVQSVLLVALMVLGCKNDDEGTGTDGQTGSASEASTVTATGTGTGTATDSGGGTDVGMTMTPTGGVLTSTDGESSSAGETAVPTTGEPVVCDSPEGCTGMGGGELASFTLPFFRGKVCVSDAPQPGDPVAISMTTCVHPCLDVTAFKYKYLYRCNGAGCELGIVGYHPGTTGTNCPDDVFGEFAAEACEFSGPYPITTNPLLLGPDPFAGSGSLLVPFMTNADVEAIAGGDDASAAVWTRIESHTQAPERVFDMNFAAENQPAPPACSEGVPGCTCRDIGL